MFLPAARGEETTPTGAEQITEESKEPVNKEGMRLFVTASSSELPAAAELQPTRAHQDAPG